MAENILLIDGMYLIFSSFYSHRNMRTLKGEPTGAVYGFITRVESLIQELKPHRLVVAFDSPGKTHRHQVFPDYKAKRLHPPEELVQQIPPIKEYLQYRGIPLLEVDGIEADDIIARLSREEGRKGTEVVIFSADKDLFQLVGDNIYIYHPKVKQKLDPAEIEELFGVSPGQIVDYLSLVGDSSDNIPGVPGIGEKTAKKLIEAFGSLDRLLEKMDEVEEKYRQKIRDNMDSLRMSRQLIDLSLLPDFTLPEKIEAFKDRMGEELVSLYTRLSFSSLLKRLKDRGITSERQDRLAIEYHIVGQESQLRALKDRILQERAFAFDIETTDIEFFKSDLVGISISFADEGFYIPFLVPEAERSRLGFTFDLFKGVMQDVFGDENIKKTGHNIKFDILHLKHTGIEVRGIGDDSMLTSYLIAPNRRAHNLKDLTLEFLDYRQVDYDSLVGKGKDRLSPADVPVDRVGRYCIDDSVLSLKLADILGKSIEEKELSQLYRDIEIPLIEVLTEMEYVGVKIDVDFLKTAAATLTERIGELEQEIYRLAGYQLNLNSSQQLGELLFEKMNLPVKKRTRKTRSYSTDIEVLEELKGFPVVARLIDYRTFKKLLSTYLEGLLERIDAAHRVHTSFNQTVTATGRLSSSDPNLQNIPVGETGGVNVRKAFIPGGGKHLLSADYSQIELRVMAHFSGDEGLIDAFNRDFDIHQYTADTVFGKDPLINDQEKRKRAKIINFSVLYGSGPFSLSRELGVGYKEAKKFIDMYFDRYKGVRQFIEQTIRQAEQTQEVNTLTGRIRPIPEIVSSNRTVKENGNRMAINTIIQGSAADIIKIAMVNIHRKLNNMNMTSSLIMQVHDELVFEYPPQEESQLFQLVKQEMEQAVTLKVPLKVTLKKGPNWGDLQKVPI
jgi:DNA polymerase-1